MCSGCDSSSESVFETPDPTNREAPVPTDVDTPGQAAESAAYLSYRTRNWEIEDGLLGRASDVVQTTDGYLWVATDEGLFRFDGARFVEHTTATVSAFHSDDFVSVDVLSSGDLWVGSRDGWTYRLRDGEWTAYPVDLRGDWVQGVVEDGEGGLWAASTGRSVARFDGAGWVTIEQLIQDVWPLFVADADGTIWTYLDGSDVPGSPASPLQSSPDDPAVVARWDGERFTPTDDWHLYGFEVTQYGPLFHRPASAQGVPPTSWSGLRVLLSDADGTPRGDYVIEDVPRSARLVDRAGRVWVEPLVSDGSIAVLDGGTEVARFRPQGAKWIEAVYEDRQGNFWVTSSGGGLLQITPEPFRRFGEDEGAPLDAESAFATADGEVLVSAAPDAPGAPLLVAGGGTVASGRIRLDSTSVVPDHPHEAPSVGAAMEDGRGRRFGTSGTRLVQIDGSKARTVWRSPGPDGLRTPFPDPGDPDVLWVGDRGGGLWRFDVEALAATDSLRVPLPASGYVWPTDVHRTPDGRLWVASRGGLVAIEGGQRHTVEALVGVPVRDLMTGPDGLLWAATETRGLVRLRDGTMDVLSVDGGLPTSFVVAVLFDDNGFVWLSGRTLLYRVRTAEVLRAFDDPAAGPVDVVALLPSAGHLGAADVMARAAKASDGSLWIPSGNGVTRIDPAAYVRQFAEPPPVLVEAIRTESGDLGFAGGASVRLPRGERSLMVSYTALDLTAPDLVRFRTRLDGLEDEWQDQGAARSIQYAGLGPGTYTLEVQARNGGGVWSEPVAATIVVPALYYETGWFATLCVLALLGAFGLAIRARERAQTVRRRWLEAIVDERTEQLRAEKETVAAQARDLETLDRAKSAFFANVSHEFRTPLTLTLGPLEDLQAGLHGPLADPQAQQVDLARRNAGRVLDLINQILEVARLESGRTPLRARPLDLVTFVEAVAEPLAAQAERRGLAFEVIVPAAAVEVVADPTQLETALGNLLSNAVKFTPGGGTVRVSAEADGTEAHVAVRDSGPGIPAADLPHVFDRFYQVGEDAGTRLGTGIGLALAKEVVDLHGGTLSVESEAGFGSTFTITLPLGRAHLAPEQVVDAPGPWARAEPEPLAVPGGDGAAGDPTEARALAADAEDDADRTTVLVVEDHPDVRAYVRRHLEEAYRVLEAADGEAGLRAAREHLPDLVVSDVMMPKLDGLGLCRALKADPETDFIPVVLLTAKATQEDRLDGLRQLCDDYLTKPFEPVELRARIANLIAVRTRLRERIRQPAEVAAVPKSSSAPEIPSADAVFVADVRAAVEANLSDPDFGTEALAEVVGQSRTTLYRRLKATTGQTPSETLRAARLDRAAALLAARAGTVGEVAYGVGYKSVAHFSNGFLEHHGCRPSAYAAENAD